MSVLLADGRTFTERPVAPPTAQALKPRDEPSREAGCPPPTDVVPGTVAARMGRFSWWRAAALAGVSALAARALWLAWQSCSPCRAALSRRERADRAGRQSAAMRGRPPRVAIPLLGATWVQAPYPRPGVGFLFCPLCSPALICALRPARSGSATFRRLPRSGPWRSPMDLGTDIGWFFRPLAAAAVARTPGIG